MTGHRKFVTKTGRVLTEAELDEWVAEAERGYDVSQMSEGGDNMGKHGNGQPADSKPKPSTGGGSHEKPGTGGNSNGK